MKTIRDLTEALRAGSRPVVTFCEGIGEKESYAEAGMRARILGATPMDHDGVLRLTFDFAEFETHNASFESANYYDKGGKPVLTARQAGYYKPQEDLYFDLDEELATLMQLEVAGSVALYNRYKAEGCPGTYVGWLEHTVLAAQSIN